MCGQSPTRPIGFRAANDSRWSRSSSDGLHWTRTTSLAVRLGRVRGSQGEPHVRHVRAASAARCVIGRLHRRALERLRLKPPRSHRGEDHPRDEQGPRDPRAAEAALEPRPRARRRRPFEGRCGARTASGTATTRGASAATSARARVGENIAWMRGCSAQQDREHVAELRAAPPRSCSRARSAASASASSGREQVLRDGGFRLRAASLDSAPSHARSATVRAAMRRAFEHPLAPALGCALALRGLPAGPAGDRRHGRALLSRVAVRARRADGLERAVVRRAPRARVLAAVRAAGGRVRARRSSACCPRSPPSRCSSRSRARPRLRPTAARRGVVAVHRRRAVERRDRADAVPARDRARGRRLLGRARASDACSRACSRCARCSPARSRACS